MGWEKVGGMSERATIRGAARRSDNGFSLIEVVVATGILATGLLSLAGVFSLGMVHMAGSTPGVIAREKAREAVESVHTARDTGNVPWDKIRNVPAPGVFLTGAQSLYAPGADGLANTADDAAAGLEKLPGIDNILGTSDDVPLKDYTREIQITNLLKDATVADPNPTAINPNLRQIRVIVKYKVAGFWRTYTLTTYVSSFS
jgi:prepilin-type N-terminal cleavage/methylation domain-containing protein